MVSCWAEISSPLTSLGVSIVKVPSEAPWGLVLMSSRRKRSNACERLLWSTGWVGSRRFVSWKFGESSYELALLVSERRMILNIRRRFWRTSESGTHSLTIAPFKLHEIILRTILAKRASHARSTFSSLALHCTTCFRHEELLNVLQVFLGYWTDCCSALVPKV